MTAARAAATGRVVDSHLHVWDLDAGGYAWLTPGHGDLYATFTPEMARAALDAAGVGYAVLVQAEDSERDTRFLLDVAGRNPWVAGVVGWIRLDDPVIAARQLDDWQRHPAFCGVRHLVHDDPRDDFLDLDVVRATLRGLAARGLPFDVPDAWPRHLAGVVDLASALPDLRVVVDHLGKPPRGRGDFGTWRATLAAVAERPNTVGKVSGLQVPGQPYTVRDLRPVWEAGLEHFGPERLMYGGDWPMTVTCGGYARTWEVLGELIDELSESERGMILAGTATAIYGLADVDAPISPPVDF